ncbi:outer membrane protein assembly factor [Shimia litoralis]|uniref:Outer membrane protein assembly factor n=2 Tax=Shimia litoralis TaxID=420403 RepID=A0A4U7MXZ4_9RHOB|nr:outer membrane protein assembly factor [Shimia litoralis]
MAKRVHQPKRLGTLAAGWAFAAVCMMANVAHAFEVTLNAPEEVEGRLKSASILMAAQRDGVTGVQDITAAAQAEYQRLVSVLYDEGYFGPTVNVLLDGREAATLPPFAKIASISNVTINVKPGKLFLFETAKVTPIAPETTLPTGFAKGEPASTSTIVTAAAAGVEGWRDVGHAKAKVEGNEITANHRNATLNATVHLDPGPKLKFGALNLSGATDVRESRLRRIVSLPSGETFDPQVLVDAEKRLRRTGVFRSVNVSESKSVGADNSMDIDVTLEDDKKRRLKFETYLESSEGLALSVDWVHRNLFGGAERLTLGAEVSGIGGDSPGTDFLLSAELMRPSTFNAESDVSMLLEAERINEDLYFIEQVTAKFLVTRVYSDQFTLAGGFMFNASNVRDNYGARSFRNFGIPLAATWDLRDDKLDPTGGMFLRGEVMPFAAFGDGDPGTYVFSDLRGYVGLGATKKVVAAGRFQVGSILGPSLSQTPPDMLFLSGGGGTVRGQPYQSNFVTVNGIESGGLSFVGLSGELRVRVKESISAVAFYDAGYVGETSNPGGAGNWHAGAGLGMRYHTGFGPIRVDIGLPVEGDTGDGWQLYVGIGQAF